VEKSPKPLGFGVLVDRGAILDTDAIDPVVLIALALEDARSRVCVGGMVE